MSTSITIVFENPTFNSSSSAALDSVITIKWMMRIAAPSWSSSFGECRPCSCLRPRCPQQSVAAPHQARLPCLRRSEASTEFETIGWETTKEPPSMGKSWMLRNQKNGRYSREQGGDITSSDDWIRTVETDRSNGITHNPLWTMYQAAGLGYLQSSFSLVRRCWPGRCEQAKDHTIRTKTSPCACTESCRPRWGVGGEQDARSHESQGVGAQQDGWIVFDSKMIA